MSTGKSRKLDAAERGAVRVSPCFSPGEKQIARTAMEEGLSLIALKTDPFTPKYKLPGKYFDSCASGNLLLLAPYCNHEPYMARNQIITRAQCLALNKLAADICGPGAASLNYAGLIPLE